MAVSQSDQAETAYGSDRKREIAKVALELFAARGYAGTAMSHVAKASGITKGALYHHFSGKEELFVSALAMDAQEPIEAIEALAAQTGAAGKRWRAALGHAHDAVFIGAMGRLLPVLAQTGNQIPTVAQGYHDNVIARFRESLTKIYFDAARDDGYRELISTDIEQLVFGPLLANALTANLMANSPDLKDQNLPHANREGFISMIDRLTRT